MATKKNYTINGYTYDGDTIRERVIAYNNSPKGKQKRKEWLANNNVRIKMWQKNHFKQKREWAKQNGYCTTCFKNKTEGGFKTCLQCIERQRGVKTNES